MARGTLNHNRSTVARAPLVQESFTLDPTGFWAGCAVQASGKTTLAEPHEQQVQRNAAHKWKQCDREPSTGFSRFLASRGGKGFRIMKTLAWPVLISSAAMLSLSACSTMSASSRINKQVLNDCTVVTDLQDEELDYIAKSLGYSVDARGMSDYVFTGHGRLFHVELYQNPAWGYTSKAMVQDQMVLMAEPSYTFRMTVDGGVTLGELKQAVGNFAARLSRTKHASRHKLNRGWRVKHE